ncbi:putative membrane protein [Lysobacter antibioticus]|nr:putative membrane protein [Lysobacter antibioticus]
MPACVAAIALRNGFGVIGCIVVATHVAPAVAAFVGAA